MRVALLLLLVAPAVALAQAGRLLLAAGEVTLLRGAQEIRALTGTAVEPGDTIRVGPRSSVQLRMSDRSIISLRANTVFRIDEYVFSGRGEETDRSIFSLLKGGMRTVGGAIARQQSDALLRTSARPDAPSGPQPAAEEKRPRDESDSKVFDLIKAPLRTVAGALTPTRHAVRVPTATIGVRGTHYTLVHCDNDCFEPRRTSVAAALLAQSDAGAPGVGNLAPNGTYGGISDGLIGVVNNRDDQEFGANSFFYVASLDSPVQSLIGPPAFLYDRLEAQERSRGQTAKESTATMAQSGLNAESRPSDTPIPPAPPTFIVTEQRSDTGALSVVPGAPGNPVAPLVAPTTAFLSAFTNAKGPSTVGAFVDASAVNLQDIGNGIVLLNFSVPAGSTIDTATGNYSGSANSLADIGNEGSANPLNASWGHWAAGFVGDASGTTSITSLNIFHYLVGPNTPPEVISAKSGTFTMTMVGGTAPTDNFGLSGAFTAGTTVTVNFGATPSVAFPITTILIARDTWTFSPSTSPITIQDGRGAFLSNTASGSCSGTGCGVGAATLARSGIFMGAAGDHLGVALHGRATSGATMQATQLFSCAPTC